VRAQVLTSAAVVCVCGPDLLEQTLHGLDLAPPPGLCSVPVPPVWGDIRALTLLAQRRCLYPLYPKCILAKQYQKRVGGSMRALHRSLQRQSMKRTLRDPDGLDWSPLLYCQYTRIQRLSARVVLNGSYFNIMARNAFPFSCLFSKLPHDCVRKTLLKWKLRRKVFLGVLLNINCLKNRTLSKLTLLCWLLSWWEGWDQHFLSCNSPKIDSFFK
jgi:hypothetical protein